MIYQKFIDKAIRVFLCILPLFLFKNYIPSFAQGMFFLMGSFFLYGLTIGTQPIRRFKNDWLRFVYLWLLICVFFKLSTPQSEWFNFWMSSGGFLYVLAGILLFTTAYSYTYDVKKFIYPIIIVSVLNFIMVLCQIAGHDFLWFNAPGICGFFSTDNQLSQYSVMVTPLLYFINPFLSIIPIFMLIISGSLSGHLALLVGLIFLTLTRQIRKIIVFPVILILVMTFACTHPITKIPTWLFVSRVSSWEKAANFITKKPWLGYGYQSYTETVKGKVKTVGYYDGKANPASDIMHNALEFGILIIVVAGLFIFGLWDKFRNRRKDRITYFLMASVLIGLSNMFWQNMIRYAAVGGTFIILVALLTIKLDEYI